MRVDDATKPARGEPAIARGFVDRHDAADLQRLPLLLLAAARRFRGIVQHLELRLKNLEAVSAAIAGLDFAVQRDQHSGAKLVLQDTLR